MADDWSGVMAKLTAGVNAVGHQAPLPGSEATSITDESNASSINWMYKPSMAPASSLEGVSTGGITGVMNNSFGMAPPQVMNNGFGMAPPQAMHNGFGMAPPPPPPQPSRPSGLKALLQRRMHEEKDMVVQRDEEKKREEREAEARKLRREEQQHAPGDDASTAVPEIPVKRRKTKWDDAASSPPVSDFGTGATSMHPMQPGMGMPPPMTLPDHQQRPGYPQGQPSQVGDDLQSLDQGMDAGMVPFGSSQGPSKGDIENAIKGLINTPEQSLQKREAIALAKSQNYGDS
jgi:hypothetical protein